MKKTRYPHPLFKDIVQGAMKELVDPRFDEVTSDLVKALVEADDLQLITGLRQAASIYDNGAVVMPKYAVVAGVLRHAAQTYADYRGVG